MRRGCVLAVCAALCAFVGGCTPEDTPHLVVSLPAATGNGHVDGDGNGSHAANVNSVTIEAGTAMTLDARQQEAVIVSVMKWMKHPSSVRFGPMEAARDSRDNVTVCGHVAGRNSAGVQSGLVPYIGLLTGTLTGPRAQPEFIVVGIGGSRRERAEVLSLCRETAAFRTL